MNAVRTIGEKVNFLEMMTNFTVNSYLNWTCGKKNRSVEEIGNFKCIALLS